MNSPFSVTSWTLVALCTSLFCFSVLDLGVVQGQDVFREDYLRNLFEQYHERRLILFPSEARLVWF
ncbi:MAG: hypothetical protein ACKO8U_05690 [Pirellula sp.]